MTDCPVDPCNRPEYTGQRKPIEPCSIPGCDSPSRTRHMCVMHYTRWKRTGDPGEPTARLQRDPHPTCSIEGCGRVTEAAGLCVMHNNRRRRNGDPLVVKPWGGKTETTGYTNAHNRVRLLRGPVQDHTCEACERRPGANWAYDHCDPDELLHERSNGSFLRYSVRPEHYIALCLPCHRRFDRITR